MSNQKPWWAPDAQGFLAASIVIICSIVVLIRLFKESTVDDKVLDMMITILFSTCLVTVFNYSFGSSRGSQAKDESQTKIVESMTTNNPTNMIAAAAHAAAAVAPIAAAAAAKAAAPPAAEVAAPPAAEAAAPAAAREAVAEALGTNQRNQ